jgi:Resolvase, N terminal domain
MKALIPLSREQRFTAAVDGRRHHRLDDIRVFPNRRRGKGGDVVDELIHRQVVHVCKESLPKEWIHPLVQRVPSCVDCRLISLHEGVDTSTPNGRLVFGIFASIAEFERELMRSRVRSGLAAARAKGKTLGRPKRVLDIQRIATLRAQGFGWKKIASDMGVGVGTLIRHAR